MAPPGASKGSISLFGIGRLGICTALCFEKAGYNIVGVDVNPSYVDKINKKTLQSPEPRVNELLVASSNFRATTDEREGMEHSDIILIVVATPSTAVDSRHYDTATLSSVLTTLNNARVKNKHIVICCTVLPGYCRNVGQFLIRDCENCTLSYNPEFIAQGDVVNGLLKPDMVLIGEGSREAGDILERMYLDMVENEPQIKRMSADSAEITKLSINCFITTKIAFANMIGDVADRTEGANKHDILDAVGADTRIGKKYLRPGYGFGGPCFPRDNRALGAYIEMCGIEPKIPVATDESNQAHTKLQAEEMLATGQQEYLFTQVAYKENCTVPIIEESQKLKIAAYLARAGRKVTIRDRSNIVLAVQQQYGCLFTYEEEVGDDISPELAKQPHATAMSSTAQGAFQSLMKPHVACACVRGQLVM